MVILICEPICTGRVHAPFNAGMLLAALALPSQPIFLGDETHVESVQELLDVHERSLIRWQTIAVEPRREDSIMRRIVAEWDITGEVWRAAESNNAAAVIFSSVSEAGLVAIKARAALSRRAEPVGVVFHSILGQFLYSRKRRVFFSSVNRANLRFLILGDSLRTAVAARAPRVGRIMRTMTHPYAFQGAPELSSTLVPTDITFGFLGAATIARGFPLFLHVAEDIAATNVHFELVGPVNIECRTLLAAFQERHGLEKLAIASSSGENLPSHLYRERLRSLSYIVLPHDSLTYEFTRSGAVLDAVWSGKPIIALRNPGTEELFGRIGDVGHLCNTSQELTATIREIASNPPIERYTRQSNNLISSRTLFGSTAVASELRKALGL